MGEKLGCVYAIRCKENGRIYIGSTIHLEDRIYTHFRKLKERIKARASKESRMHVQVTWQQDYDKFGKDAFEVYVIEQDIPQKNLREREAHWVQEYKSRDIRYGYNSRRVMKEDFDIKTELPPKPF